MTRHPNVSARLLALTVLIALSCAPACTGDDPAGTTEDRLDQYALGEVTIVRGDDGEIVAIIGRLIPPDTVTPDAEAIGRFFFDELGGLFGIDDSLADVMLIDREDSPPGPSGAPTARLIYQRRENGYRIVGARLTLAVDNGWITSVMGNVPRNVEVPLAATVTESQATATVMAAETGSSVSGADLVILNEGIFENRQTDPSSLVWAVSIAQGLTSRTRFVHAVSGTLLDFTLTGSPSARNRSVSTVSAACPMGVTGDACVLWIQANGTQVYNEAGAISGTMPTADATQAYSSQAVTYDYIQSTFGYDSYDGSGATMYAYTDSPEVVDNAFTIRDPGGLGSRLYFGAGMVTDDILAHEFGHQFLMARGIDPPETGQTADLHEAYGDIFAAWVDSANPWLIGEGSSLGVIRTAATPTRDHMDDYVAGGDPHENCTIFSHGYYLLTAGPVDLRPIGMTKSQHMYFKAAREYFGGAVNFDLAKVSLWLASLDMISRREQGLSYYDCGSMHNALDAVGIGTGDMDRDCFPDDLDICPTIYNPDQSDPALCIRPFGSCLLTDALCNNYHYRDEALRTGCELGGGVWSEDSCVEEMAQAACVLFVGSDKIQMEAYYDIPDDTARAFIFLECLTRPRSTGGPGIFLPTYVRPTF